MSERKSGESTQIVHYGDLTDLPTYDANAEGKTTTSYVQGPRGLLEQRSAETTLYPLADSHGDITALTGPTGSVESRQSYDPWGTQLSGPSLEMGYLGAYERRADPITGLIQMGARSYGPALGRFMSEDPVLGHLGIGTSFNRHAYVWGNPLNLYDLDGLDVCVPTPFGDACAEAAVEDVGNAAGNAAGSAGSAAESAWNWTQPGRQWVSDRAQDFVKSLKEQCDSSFGNRARNNFMLTNEKFLGLAAPTFSSGKINTQAGIATKLGTETPYQWARNSRIVSELPGVARAAGLSWLYASLAWETGIGIGSLIRSGLSEWAC